MVVLRPHLAACVLAAAALLAGCAGPPRPPADSEEHCLALLDGGRVSYTRVSLGAQRDPRCHIDAAIRVSRIGAALDHRATMSCFLAERLDRFEREAIPRLAAADLGQRVSRIDHLGAYSCRANTGRPDRLSEHAYGLAIDIAGFHLADGSAVSVERDWWTPGPKRNFLHHFARAACDYFSVVLTPDSNRDHFNHIHLDIGPDRLCSI